MAKKQHQEVEKGEKNYNLNELSAEMLKRLPKEEQERIEKNKKNIEQFVEECTKKFQEYILGIALLPLPPGGKDASGNVIPEGSLKFVVLVDDQDSKSMSKLELKEKLMTINEQIAQGIDKMMHAESILISEIWQSLYDAKLDLLQTFAFSAPLFDKGMLAALKIGELHKTMAIKKFEKYIVSYVLFGSLTRGEATHESDIDVAIIVDDTDVKKMSLFELKDKLRAIIHGMGIEAGEMTGIKNKLNIQLYILTEFWDSVKEAHPVIFTILRDGVPLYDRGMFMPWKQLLRMGKIKPSPEAIDMFMGTGEQTISRIKQKLKGLVEADLYWSTLTPTQAALMLYGMAPPTPKETIKLMEEVFVKKEKLLEMKYVNIMQEIRDYYKGLEHGTIKDISGKEIDDLLKKAEDYLERIKKLFEQIEVRKQEESVMHAYESAVTIVRDTLVLEGIQNIPDDKVQSLFEEHLVASGKIPERYKRIFKELIQAKIKYVKGELLKPDIENIAKDAREFMKQMIEYMQRKRGKELEKARIRLKYGDKFGEVILLENHAYIIHDIDAEDKKITKAQITKEGGITSLKDATLDEFEKDLATAKMLPRVFIKQAIFADLKKVFGDDVEVLITG